MKEVKEKSTNKLWWRSKTMRLMLSLICIGAIICVAMFVSLGVSITRSSNKTIDDVGEIYMKGMGSQVASRFETAISLRLNMVEALVKTINPAELGKDDVDDELRLNALARGFGFLAYYDANGDMQMILGRDAHITDPEPFKLSLTTGKQKVAVGTGIDADGNTDSGVVFMGVPTTDYIMSDGVTHSAALVAGMSNDDIVEMLSIDRIDTTEVYSHIIRKNGTFVIRSEEEVNGFADYFEQIRNRFEPGSPEAEVYIDTLRTKMENDETYSAIMYTSAGRIHIYCEKLPMSEWYLVTIMDYGALDLVIEHFSTQWIILAIVSSAVIVIVLVSIMIVYMYFSHQNNKQLEDARQAAVDANKAKSEFLSNMSHDIRTPMNAIVGMTAIATANIDNKQQVQDCLKKITLSSKHLLGLINDVLDMSKIESGKMTLNMEQISLREVMDGISTIVQPQIKIKNQRFDVFIHDILTENVYCDSVRLNQVLLNLLSNAIKFTPEHGTINLSLHQEPSPLGDNYVRNHIGVEDTGIGMTPEFQKKIFESFTREDSMRVHKIEGTGLGMTITKYIVDAMKGSIEVSSELGKGAKFHVVLDLERVDEIGEEMILPDWRMLVVDDDEILCRTTVESLGAIGIRADWTLSGEDAIKKTVDAHRAGGGYDIILLDWKLPGIDGIETARQIRKELGEVPILLISAYDWGDMEDKAREAGISGFIGKPLFKSTLYNGLRKFIGDGKTPVEPEKDEKVDELVGKRILIAEDNDLNWEIAEMLLTDCGLVVERAENGQICVDMLTKSKKGTYDAILMDIRMPVMNGLDATVAIRKLDHPDSDLPIIAMTADAFSDDMKKCIECGMNAHVAKPIDMDVVKSTLIKFINKRNENKQ